MNQVLGAFGLLEFTMLRPVLAWRILKLMNRLFLYLIFQFFSGCGKPRITETADTESVETVARLYLIIFF
jgi:hypothetical protein